MADKALRIKELETTYTGSCNAMDGQHYILLDNSSFSYEDINILLEEYYNGEGERHIHMSDINGRICWKSMGEVGNRKLADQLKKNCYSTLKGEGSKEKCDAIYNVVDSYAKAPQSHFDKFFEKHPNIRAIWDTVKWPAGAILGGWGFHVGWDIHKKMKGKDPDDKPPIIPSPPPPPPQIEYSPDTVAPPSGAEPSRMVSLDPPPEIPWYAWPMVGLITFLVGATEIVLPWLAQRAAPVYQTARAPSLMLMVDPSSGQGNPYMNPGSNTGPI